MADSLATFATTGKLNFKGLVTSILSDLAKMEAKIAASSILKEIVGAFSPGGAAPSGGVQSLGGNADSYSGINDGSLPVGFNFAATNAKGGAYGDSPSLAAFSGQIVKTATPFMFAKGGAPNLGIMGEKGGDGEAILPLQRGAGGILGVRAQMSGGSSGGGDVFNITTQVTVGGDGTSTTQQNQSKGNALVKEMSSQMTATARAVIVNESKPGGIIWKQKNGN